MNNIKYILVNDGAAEPRGKAALPRGKAALPRVKVQGSRSENCGGAALNWPKAVEL